MYKKDVSDYNPLKNQRDYSKIIKKYESRKLKTEPTELQKYYQYLTYQQPILDELNYVSERMKNEDIRTKTNDFNFLEDLRKKREESMKVNSKKEKDEGIATLFEPEKIIEPDMTPTIITELELEQEAENRPIDLINIPSSDLFGDEDAGIYGPEFGVYDYEKEPLTEDEKAGRRQALKAINAGKKIGAAVLGKLKADKYFKEEVEPKLKIKAASRLQESFREKQKNLKGTEKEREMLKNLKAEKAAKKEAVAKIQSVIKAKQERNKFVEERPTRAATKIQKAAKAANLRGAIDERIRLKNIEKDFTDALSLAPTEAEKEKVKEIFQIRRGAGRPKGSKNKPKAPKP